jgi:VWFA-related protein
LTCIGAGALLAQVDAQRPDQKQDIPVFRSGVISVMVDVAVTGRNDAPVSGLTAADFELRDSGRIQKITSCEHVAIPVNGRPLDLKARSPVLADVATNDPPPVDSRAFVFVVAPSVDSSARRVMPEFLRNLTAADRAALIFMYQSRRSEDFTNDLGRLTAAVNAPAAWDSTVFDGLRLTLDALSNSVTALEAAPQTRKVIVLLSRGEAVSLAPNTRNARGQLVPGVSLAKAQSRAMDFAAFLEKARRSGIPVYTINPDTSSMMARVGGPAEASREFLMTIASATGGVGYTNTDPLPAARRLMADNSEYYVLTFTPEPYTPDGTFHELAVSVPGRPEVRVRSRGGYFARQANPESDPSLRMRRLLEQAQPGGDMPLRAFAAPVAKDPVGARVLLAFEVEYSESVPGVSADLLSVQLVAHDLEGKILANVTRTVTVPVSGRRPPFTVALRDAITLPAVRVGVRGAVASRALGRAGVVHLPIDLTGFGRNGLAVTPIMLGRADAPQLDAQEPTIHGLSPIEITTERVFSVGDEVQMFARVFDAGASRLEAALSVRTEAGEQVELTPTVGASTTPGIDIRSQTLPLNQLGPGQHVLQLSIKSNGKRVAERALIFRVR